MTKIPEAVVEDWVKNKKRIQDRLNRIKKRLKKYEKQEKHFSMRLRAIKDYEDKNK
jgi:chaperonin cofactor prefoldin